jgi:hypothetical protein
MSTNEDNPTGSPSPTTPVPGGVGFDLATAELLEDFRKRVGELSRKQKQALIAQALILIEQVYVHLPLKKAMYAANPVERLAVLSRRLDDDAFSTLEFHEELIEIFTSLRDLHTRYALPEPFLRQAAFLPFLVEEFYDESDTRRANRRYVVSHFSGTATDPEFKAGVEVLDWNGVGIDLAVRRNAEREAGGNDEARRARGVDALTIRPLDLSAMPDEDSVVVGYRGSGGRREERFPWRVFQPSLTPTGIDRGHPVEDSKLVVGRSIRYPKDPKATETSVSSYGSPKGPSPTPPVLDIPLPEDDEDQGERPPPIRRLPPTGSLTAKGIDTKTEIARRVKKTLYAPDAMAEEVRLATPGAKPTDPNTQSLLPDVFSFRTVDTNSGKFGYVRIWTFDIDDPRVFLKEFLRILSLIPQEGVILDVRGNGGGSIHAGEAILQVLTPRRIEPESFHFITSPLMAKLTKRVPDLKPWRASMKRAAEIGDLYSQGIPLASPDWYNLVGQRYHGRVALIVDALCYSTTDIFAAGFQDHDIGVIIGTSTRTGAGGANVWELDTLREQLGADAKDFPKLPEKATFRMAVRGSTRVGTHSNEPLEDLGVEIPSENVYAMKLKDEVPASKGEANKGLIEFAAQKLMKRPAYVLCLEVQPDPKEPHIKLKVRTKNLMRLDILVNDRQWYTTNLESLKESTDEYSLPEKAPCHGWVELRGYTKDGILAAAYKFLVGPRQRLTPSAS